MARLSPSTHVHAWQRRCGAFCRFALLAQRLTALLPCLPLPPPHCALQAERVQHLELLAGQAALREEEAVAAAAGKPGARSARRPHSEDEADGEDEWEDGESSEEGSEEDSAGEEEAEDRYARGGRGAFAMDDGEEGGSSTHAAASPHGASHRAPRAPLATQPSVPLLPSLPPVPPLRLPGAGGSGRQKGAWRAQSAAMRFAPY